MAESSMYGRIQRIAHQKRVERALRDITPLWQTVAAVLPDVTLNQTNLNDRADVVLYRRIIEIRDAQLLLMRYARAADHHTMDPGAECSRREDRAAILEEAQALTDAIDNYRAGHRQPPHPLGHRNVKHCSAIPDILAEAHWLIRVHRAMRGLPAARAR